MNKKLAIFLSIFVLVVLSFSVCFANNMVNDAVNGVRNVVGGAENAVEGAANGIANGIKGATNSVENTANDVVNTMKTNGDNDNTAKDTNNETGTTTNTMTGNYTATRTNAEGDSTLMGMNATTWTWLIIGLATIAIVALVWYYSMQMRSSNYDDRD